LEKQFTEIELKKLEKQLSCPTGEQGKEVGRTMHDSNIDMTIASIEALKLRDENTVLEMGHGNCNHLNEVLKQAKDIRFFGLEISKTMFNEAKRINSTFLTNKNIEFLLYDGEKTPFNENTFDKILTVNTLYFWRQPVKMLNEIYRILKDDGVVAITFAQKEFMKTIPFVMGKFNLFDTDDLIALISKTNFSLEKIIDNKKRVKSKDGENVNRHYSIVLLKK
jgi:ubiquinone/menaquinone biosynthesis C-methylase UbiE